MSMVVVGIDPIDKINAANDAKVQSDIAKIATAMETYAVVKDGVYAADQNTLVTNGDLKATISAPTGYGYAIVGGATGKVYSVLKSKKYTSTPNWVWCSASGKAGATVNPAGTCP